MLALQTEDCEGKAGLAVVAVRVGSNPMRLIRLTIFISGGMMWWVNILEYGVLASKKEMLSVGRTPGIEGSWRLHVLFLKKIHILRGYSGMNVNICLLAMTYAVCILSGYFLNYGWSNIHKADQMPFINDREQFEEKYQKLEFMDRDAYHALRADHVTPKREYQRIGVTAITAAIIMIAFFLLFSGIMVPLGRRYEGQFLAFLIPFLFAAFNFLSINMDIEDGSMATWDDYIWMAFPIMFYAGILWWALSAFGKFVYRNYSLRRSKSDLF